MIRRYLLLVSIIVLVSGLAYGFFSTGPFLNTEPSIQSVFADNTINNQTSASNTDCDTTSSCTTSPSQSAVIAGGDENKIDQHMSLDNDHCTGSSSCELIGNQQASISETINGEISDGGINNENTQDIQRNDESNNNIISQDGSQLNKRCDENSNCEGTTNSRSFVGRIQEGFIDSLGNDSKNTQTVSKSKSGSDNRLSQLDNQVIEDCPATNCSNSVAAFSEQNIGFTFGGVIGDFGVNSINTQNSVIKDSSDKNVMTNTGKQEIIKCQTTLDSRHFCSNGAIHTSNIGGGDLGAIFSFDNNTVNTMNVLTTDSSNENKIFDGLKQQVKDCLDIQCTNTINNGFTIGRNLGGTIGTFGSNNIISNDNVQLESGNLNKVSSQNNQQNNRCKTNNNCDNFGGSLWSIGLNNGGSISNSGSSNVVKQTTTQSNVAIGSVVNSLGDQQNKNCQDNTGCVNFLSTAGVIGATSNGFIETFGDNNIIDKNVNAVNSASNNNVDQKAKQVNNGCTDASICFNQLGAEGDVDITSGGGIFNSGDNNSISNNFEVVNSNNNNKILQEGGQSNEHCSESSSCFNFGVVTTTIGLVQGSDISNSESNAKIDESVAVKDSNNGNVISQKLDQNNQCQESLELQQRWHASSRCYWSK